MAETFTIEVTFGRQFLVRALESGTGNIRRTVVLDLSQAANGALATPTLTNSSALGAAPLVLSWSSTDYTVGLFGQLQIATDNAFSTITQNIVFFIDGTSWANLNESIGLVTPSGTYYARIRVCQDDDSGATTVTGTDPSGNVVSFSADISPWSSTFTDTINVASTVWNTTTGSNKSTFLTISGSPALTVTGPGGGFGGARCFVRATAAPTGKRQFEITLSAYSGGANPFFIGIDDGSQSFGPGSVFPSPYANSVLWANTGGGGSLGLLYVNGTLVQTPQGTQNPTDIITVRFDTVAGSVSFYINGTQSGTTVTGLTLSNYYAVVADEQSDVLVGNFGQSAFSGLALSSGYLMYG